MGIKSDLLDAACMHAETGYGSSRLYICEHDALIA